MKTQSRAAVLLFALSVTPSIAGVMLTTFVLIPIFPVSTLLYIWLAVAVLTLAALLRFLRTPSAT